MNRQEYFEILLNKFPEISEEDREQIRSYYEELICDGIEAGHTEEEMLERLGDPGDLAGQMQEEWEMRKMPAVQRETDVTMEADSRKGGMPARLQNQDTGCCTVETPQITEVEITAEDHRIEVVPSADECVHIYYPQRIREEIRWYEEGNRLIFRHKAPFRLFLLRISSDPIVVQIPAARIRGLYITVKNAAVSLKGQILDEVRVKTSNGGITGENLAVRELVAETHNAPLVLRGLSGEKFQCSTTNGKVSLENLAGVLLEAHSSNGKISMKHVHTVEQEAGTSNGRITSEYCKARRCSYSTTNGPIELTDLEGTHIDLHTSNSSIRGTVCGREELFDLELHTSNGKTVPDTCRRPECGKSLSAKTSNGSIRLLFTGA